MNKTYTYTLYHDDGEKSMYPIDAPNVELAQATLDNHVAVSEDVLFGVMIPSDEPEYDWDPASKAWQRRMF